MGAMVCVGEWLVIAGFASGLPFLVSGVGRDFLLARGLLLLNQQNQSPPTRI
jgi:hypothetical protein